MDIDSVLNSVESHKNNQSKRVNIVKTIGYILSSLEHRIPETLFAEQSSPVQAVSAVKAILIAQMEGQKIFTIRADNVDVINSLALSEQVKSDIRNAINLGQVATVHE